MSNVVIPDALREGKQLNKVYRPATYEQLWNLVAARWGIRIPTKAVCPGHCSPFQAFAHAFFAESPVAIWKASRGFGGKSTLLGTLVLSEAAFLGAQSTVLGGSASQSQRVHEVTHELWYAKEAPDYLLDGDPTKYVTRLHPDPDLGNPAGRIIALMASQKSVRGPHPQRLRLDEIDEMDLAILEAAQGQPQDAHGIQAQTVMCVAGWTMVLTQRGETPITDVTPTDYVMTRQGWRKVKAITMSGFKATTTLELSNGRTLTCTGDHRIATTSREGGWLTPDDIQPDETLVGVPGVHGQPAGPRAGSQQLRQVVGGVAPDGIALEPCLDDAARLGLVTPMLLPTPEPGTGAALPPFAVRPDVLGGVGVPLGAVGLQGVLSTGGDPSQDVLFRGDGLQMVGVAAGPVPAQVVDVQAIGDGPHQTDVGPAVNLLDGYFSAVDGPVPTGLCSLPLPATTWGDGAPVQEPVSVVRVVAGHAVLPVYDLEVEDVHEFVGEGIVLHNSSTHQYPDGTMTEMLKRANQKNWPVFTWCWRESVGTKKSPGWLSLDMVDRKRAEVSEQMFSVEYDLQEPSTEGRAIQSDYVDAYFDPQWGTWEGMLDKEVEIWEPVKGASYVTGVDWAKEQDWTIIRTFRTDKRPWGEVAFMRTGRRPWPHMIAQVEERLRRYGGLLVHDATGIGNVVDDLLEYEREKVFPVVMRGREREALFSDYIAAIEHSELKSARIEFAHKEHLYTTYDDLFGKGHPPDSVVSGALAWSARNRMHNSPTIEYSSFVRESPWRW